MKKLRPTIHWVSFRTKSVTTALNTQILYLSPSTDFYVAPVKTFTELHLGYSFCSFTSAVPKSQIDDIWGSQIFTISVPWNES